MRVGGAVAALVFMVASSAGAHALDFSGDLTLEGRWYPQSPAFPGQRSGTAGLVLKPTLYEEVAQSTAVTVSLFYRYDSADSQRTHADLREAHLLTYGDWDESSWELRMGLYRVFWGVAEDVLDFGLSAFVGTSREPSFLVSQRSRPPPTTDSPLIPSYEQIRQFGVDAQLTTEPWLYKMEAIHRSGARNLLGHKENYSAFILGVERTLYALFDSDADLTLLAEWHYDARGARATSVWADDLFVAGSFAFNDVDDTTLVAGILADLRHDYRSLSVELKRRLSDNWSMRWEGTANLSTDPQDLTYSGRATVSWALASPIASDCIRGGQLTNGPTERDV